ncbi:hypothetical protein E1B28_002307 [Marasmius oreades]|uniref:Uncharacterized protein n=1 Tax=Marasmius oreades TaxID=181124 RepID=A0A9P7RND7_9AGAR|nr:uncharacterized protein E1B28_002307 [Marasmius oreades]KAG7086346.1 hypothetical protein E1B28_002307 [Marasmius oreades]
MQSPSSLNMPIHLSTFSNLTHKHAALSLCTIFQIISISIAIPKSNFNRNRFWMLSYEEVWPLVKKKLSKPLATIVKQLHEDKELPQGFFEEPNFLILAEDTLTAPILLMYRIVTAITRPTRSDLSPEEHIHTGIVVLKEIIDLVPPGYWRLESVDDNFRACFAAQEQDVTLSAATDCAGTTALFSKPHWDLHLRPVGLDENIPVETPSMGVGEAARIFLRGVAAIYQYEASHRTLVNHSLCKRNVPINLSFVELERQTLKKLSHSELQSLLESWSLPPNRLAKECLACAESSVYAPHCAAAPMAVFAYSQVHANTEKLNGYTTPPPPPDVLKSWFPPASPEHDWALTIGTAKKCCPACSLLCLTLEKVLGVEFNIASGHTDWSPWWAPSWLPDCALEMMETTLLDLLRELLYTDDSDNRQGLANTAGILR